MKFTIIGVRYCLVVISLLQYWMSIVSLFILNKCFFCIRSTPFHFIINFNFYQNCFEVSIMIKYKILFKIKWFWIIFSLMFDELIHQYRDEINPKFEMENFLFDIAWWIWKCDCEDYRAKIWHLVQFSS